MPAAVTPELLFGSPSRHGHRGVADPEMRRNVRQAHTAPPQPLKRRKRPWSSSARKMSHRIPPAETCPCLDSTPRGREVKETIDS